MKRGYWNGGKEGRRARDRATGRMSKRGDANSRGKLTLSCFFPPSRIVGFEGLTMVEGKEDDFKSGALENRLKESGKFSVLSSSPSPQGLTPFFGRFRLAGVIPAPGAVPPNQQAASFNFTNSTFASGGGSGSGRRGIRQGVASRGRGSDGDDDDRSD